MTISARWLILSYPTLMQPVRALQSTGKSKACFTWHYAFVKNSLLSVTPHRVFKSNWYAINYLHPSFLIERSLLVGAVDRPHFYHSNGGFISVFFFWNSSLTSGFRQQKMVCQIYDTPFCTCLSVVKFNLFLLLAYRHSPDTDRLLFFMIVIIRTLWFE